MRRRSVQVWATKLLLATAVGMTAPLTVAAQGGQDNPRPGETAFAGGQMVRGTVTAVTADQLTVKTEAGDVYQVALSANTRLNKERQPVKAADIKVGDGVGAMGVLDPATKTVHAVFVGVIDAEQVKKARENMGKTYITGKVTAIDMDALKLTVKRPDGVSQVIGVDEQTSFKRGGRGMVAIASGAGVVEMGGGGAAAGGRGNGMGTGRRCWLRTARWRREHHICRREGRRFDSGTRGAEEWRVCADGAGCDGSGGNGAETTAGSGGR